MRISALVLSLMLSVSAVAKDYALAIRGNGELAPAHWGGIAKIVEVMGMPSGQAGGSSASVTMSFLAAIASNPVLRSVTDDQHKRANASLMIKSMHGFIIYATERPEWQDAMQLFDLRTKASNTDWLRDLDNLATSLLFIDPERAAQAISQYKGGIDAVVTAGLDWGLLNRQHPLFKSGQNLLALSQGRRTNADTLKEIARFRFFASEIKDSFAAFGQFDTRGDANILFRPGLVDFDRAAFQIGRVSGFFAALNVKPEIHEAWRSFFDLCSTASLGRTWEELVASNPECREIFNALIEEHFASQANERSNNFSLEPIGTGIRSYPTTTVLTQRAFAQAEQAMMRYPQALSKSFGESFVLDHPEDVHIGYWGNDVWGLEAKLPPSDAKSTRFKALGSAIWYEALRLSPAEPGLSPMKPFTTKGLERLFSAGGWGDLHPTLVLKAAGFENVIYVTRRGGESLFAQGLANRLWNFGRDWKLLAPENESMHIWGDKDAALEGGAWSRFYNLADPESSFNLSLRAADAILCTNWNSFKIADGPGPMIAEAYRSPFYISRKGSLRGQPGLEPTLCASMLAKNPGAYAGCFPN